MAVIFVNPKRAEELAKSPEICNDSNMYVVLTGERFYPKAIVPYPQNAKIVYFSLFERAFSRAYVCNSGKLERVDNISRGPRTDEYYYYNNVLVIETPARIALSKIIYDVFKGAGLKAERRMYLLDPRPALAYLYRATKLPLFTAFVSQEGTSFIVYALKVQDICIIYPQSDASKFNILLAVCGEKPLIYIGDGTAETTASTREILNGMKITKNLNKVFEFKRTESDATNR